MPKIVFAPLAAVFLALLLTACSQHVTSTTGSASSSASNGTAAQFIARGNEPFWTVKVNGSTLTLITPENLAGKQFNALQSVSTDSLKFTGQDQGHAFTLLIVPGTCTDSMSDEVFSYTSTWTYAGDSNTGCAASGS